MIVHAADAKPAQWPAADWSYTSPAQLVRSHLERPDQTARAYDADLRAFAKWRNTGTVDAVAHLLDAPRGAVVRTLHDYLGHLRRTASLNTARRRLASLRGLLRLAHDFGVICWSLPADTLRLPTPEPIRDTRGPDRAALNRMIDAARQRGDAKGYRDTAILRLLGICGYRANEVLTLDVAHIDLDARELDILAKGAWGRDRRRWPVDLLTARAIGRWLEFRGTADGPLWRSFDRARSRETLPRLTHSGLYELVRDWGRRCDASHCHPHALRHTAATEFLRLTNGNVAWACSLTRHRDPKTVLIYDDANRHRARTAQEIVAAGHPIYRFERDANDNY